MLTDEKKFPRLCNKKQPEVFSEEGIFKKFANFKGKHLCWSLFLIKLQKETPTQIFCYEIFEIFKNTYFEERLRATASKLLFREKPNWLIKILGFLLLQVRSKRQKQPSEVVL